MEENSKTLLLETRSAEIALKNSFLKSGFFGAKIHIMYQKNVTITPAPKIEKCHQTKMILKKSHANFWRENSHFSRFFCRINFSAK